MKRIIKADLKRSFISWRFLVAVILIFLIWELNSRRFTLYDDVLFLFVNVWGRSITPLLAMVVTSVVYVTSYCEDLENHFLRYNIVRIGVKKYVISKIIVCFFASFLVMVLGTALFVWWRSMPLCIVAEDSVTVENFKADSCFGWLLPSHPIWFIGIQVFLQGLYCAAMSVLALALSTFVRNSYGVYVLPFLLNYCFFYLFAEIAVNYPMLCIEIIYNSCTATFTDNPVFLLVYSGFVTVLFVILAYGIMYKRVKGEFQ